MNFIKMNRTPLFSLMLLALAMLLPGVPATAQVPGFDFSFGSEESFGDSRDEVKVSASPSVNSVRPGSDVVVVLVMDMNDGWHIWPKPGKLDEKYAVFEDAIRTTLILPEDQAGPISVHPGFAQWPEVHGVLADIGDGEQNYGVYEGRAVIKIPVTVSADATPGTYTFGVQVDFQSCNDSACLAPATVTPEITLQILPITVDPAADPDADPGSPELTSIANPDDFRGFDAAIFAEIRGGAKAPEVIEFDVFGYGFSIDVAGGGGFLLLLLVSALGGALLNFTPCVLPVIPLKIMGLSAAAGNRRRCFLLGFTMSLGVVAFWMVLGGLIAGVKSFEAISQLFQYPAFTITVGVVIVVMAIGMAGFFTITLPNKVYSIETAHDTMIGSFMFGIMTAVLSTPCTAPLMGAAAAWATTQTPLTVLGVFASIGGGMAVPYLVLSAFPGLVQKMPRTGEASELVKQVMGLLLLAAGAYFVGSGLAGILVTPPDPPTRMYWWVVALAGIAAGAWLTWRTPRISKAFWPRAIFCLLGVLIIWVSGFLGMRMTAKGPIDWVYYTPERFAEAVAADQVIMLDFTAEWCLNCKLLESTSLEDPEVVALTRLDEVVPMKIDLTGNNVDGAKKLKEEERLTIPLLVIYGKDGSQILKSDFYTGPQVVEAIIEAGQSLGHELPVTTEGSTDPAN